MFPKKNTDLTKETGGHVNTYEESRWDADGRWWSNLPTRSGEEPIKECRRMIPDRRMNSMHGEWIEETVIRW